MVENVEVLWENMSRCFFEKMLRCFGRKGVCKRKCCGIVGGNIEVLWENMLRSCGRKCLGVLEENV